MALQRIRTHLALLVAQQYERWKAAWYFKPQTYHVTYQVTVTAPTASAEQPTYLILPGFRQTEYQVVSNARYLTIPAAQEVLDGNPYAVWQLPAGQQFQTTYQATVAVKPRLIEPYGDATINDYADSAEYPQYTIGNEWIRPDHPWVQEAATRLLQQEKRIHALVGIINQAVQEKLHYGKPIADLYTAEQALTLPCVDCGGFDTLFVSLAIACGIPARVVSGFWAGYPTNDMHAWVEYMTPDNQWWPVDPSVEQLRQRGRSAKFAKLGLIGSDRIITSVGTNLTLKIGKQVVAVPILQTPIAHPAAGAVIAYTVTTQRV